MGYLGFGSVGLGKQHACTSMEGHDVTLAKYNKSQFWKTLPSGD